MCISVLAFLCLLLLFPFVVTCLMAEQKPHKGLGDSKSDAVQHAFNYGSQGRKCQAYGGIRSCALFFCNPPSCINIQKGLIQFTHLFVATLRDSLNDTDALMFSRRHTELDIKSQSYLHRQCKHFFMINNTSLLANVSICVYF